MEEFRRRESAGGTHLGRQDSKATIKLNRDNGGESAIDQVKQQAEAFAQDASRMQEAVDVAVQEREAAEKRETDLRVSDHQRLPPF